MTNAITTYEALLKHEILGEKLTTEAQAGIRVEIIRLSAKRRKGERGERERLLLARYQIANHDAAIELAKVEA